MHIKVFNKILFSGILVLLGVVVFFGFKKYSGTQPKSLEAYANEALADCANSPYHPTCYDKLVPTFMDQMSMEDAFQVTRLIQAKDSTYPFCHVLGHNLSAKETAKDPSKWEDVITRCPSGTCSNGCIHGAFQERFRTDVMTDVQIDTIIPDLQNVCEPRNSWHPTGLEQGSCYHALGHLLMYVTGANIKKANSICQQVAVKPDGRNYLQVCYEGNFMQIYQPLEFEDIDLVKNIAPKDVAGVRKLCAQFDPQQQGACWRESWPLSRQEILTPNGLVKFCGYFKTEDMLEKCYNALFYVIPVQVQFDQTQIANLCRGLPQSRRGQCFANSASRFIENDYKLIDQSLQFCTMAKEYGVEDRCYNELVFYASFNFHPGSPEAAHLCQAMPEPYKTRCLNPNNVH